MPDTKSGRERKGRNKRRQLESSLYQQEMEALEGDDDLPSFDAADGEFLADEPPEN